jgi:3-phenylpropionate/trans-cinnamate dioxygenase ferredoxin reductase subunit
MAPETSFVVVGGGLAGAKAVQALRDGGFAGRVSLVGAEPHRPYERPPLSKGYLMGKDALDSVFVHASDWYAEHDVDLRVGVAATALDLARRELSLSDGSTVAYDALLLATGSRPRPLPVPGADLAGVHVLRTLDDSAGLREAMAAASAIAVVGGGWIGLETAAAARIAGLPVTVLERDALPLVGPLGPELAQLFADLHRDNGVDLRCGVGVSALLGDGGRVRGVQLDDGSSVPADLVIVGVGAVPNVELAVAAGLAVDDGVLVDATLRSSDPHVWAAGDIARAEHPFLGRRVRVEHWDTARRQGEAAGRSMLGQGVPYDRLPYFYTDQYDLGMELTGQVPSTRDGRGEPQVVLRGDVAARELVAFWLLDGRVQAGMAVNQWDLMEPVERLIRSRRPVDPVRLADPGVPLDDVLRG